MSAVKFEVKKYQVTLGGDLPSIVSDNDTKVCGIIGCYGGGYQLMINFVEEGDKIPAPLYNENSHVGSIYISGCKINTFIDLLRNEKPIFAYLNSEKPEWCNISTSHEAVGEGE